MSVFIQKTDYYEVIRQSILDDITEGVDAKLDVAETRAIEFMKGYLNNRYDVTTIFSQTGSNRNPIILMYAVEIAAYYLHMMISPKAIPSLRADRYKEAKEWLENVNQQLINPPDLPVVAEGVKDYIKFNSNPKRNNHLGNGTV